MELYREGLQSYLKNRVSDNEYFCNVEYQVIQSNKLNSLLPLQLREEDRKHIVCYEITGKQSLEALKKNEMLSETECRNLMKDIISVLKDMEEYMLVLEHIHFASEEIFQDTSGKNYFVYDPENLYDSRGDMVALFSWMIEHIDYEDRKAVEFIYHVFYEVKKQDITCSLLEKCLSFKSQKSISYDTYFEGYREEPGNSAVEYGGGDSIYRNDNTVYPHELYGNSETETDKPKRPDKIFLVLMVVFIILAMISLTVAGYLIYLGYQQNMIAIYGKYAAGSGMLMALFIYGVYQMYVLYKNPSDETDSLSEAVVKTSDFSPAKTESENSAGKTALLTGGYPGTGDETVLLFDERTRVQPALKSVDTGEVYMIRSFPAVIGNDAKQCQITIHDNTVSRRHAKIEYDSLKMKYMIEDTNSSNGTFIDHVAIAAGIPVSIESGQILTFARQNFEFLTL